VWQDWGTFHHYPTAQQPCLSPRLSSCPAGGLLWGLWLLDIDSDVCLGSRLRSAWCGAIAVARASSSSRHHRPIRLVLRPLPGLLNPLCDNDGPCCLLNLVSYLPATPSVSLPTAPNLLTLPLSVGPIVGEFLYSLFSQAWRFSAFKTTSTAPHQVSIYRPITQLSCLSAAVEAPACTCGRLVLPSPSATVVVKSRCTLSPPLLVYPSSVWSRPPLSVFKPSPALVLSMIQQTAGAESAV
jgi:hypothetical protein